MKLDPRTKMVMVLCLSGLALLYNTPGRLLLLLAVTVAILLLFRFDLGAIGSYLKPFLSLMGFLWNPPARQICRANKKLESNKVMLQYLLQHYFITEPNTGLSYPVPEKPQPLPPHIC
jgi:energy-coupling factor transporter transmembrane protein EcfT